MKNNRPIAALIALVLGLSMLTACKSDAKKASENLSTAADNFEIQRQIIFYNGITGAYIQVIEGRCSVDTTSDKKLTVTCKVGDNQYMKHFLGLSDNVTWTAIQTSPAKASTYHTRIILKPENIIPDVDFK